MNWDAIGAVGEIFGALAVVVTLLYLGRQLRQESLATTGETMSSWLSDYNVLILELLRDAEVSKIIRQGLTDFGSLDSNDQMRFHIWMIAHLLNAQNLYLQRQDGVMHLQLADTVLSFNASMLSLNGGRYWWGTTRAILQPDFVAHMDNLIERAAPVTDSWPWFSTRT